MKNFNLLKGIWKVVLGIVTTGATIIIPNVLPQIIPEPIFKLTIGGLILEGLDWLLHKLGKNK